MRIRCIPLALMAACSPGADKPTAAATPRVVDHGAWTPVVRGTDTAGFAARAVYAYDGDTATAVLMVECRDDAITVSLRTAESSLLPAEIKDVRWDGVPAATRLADPERNHTFVAADPARFVEQLVASRRVTLVSDVPRAVNDGSRRVFHYRDSLVFAYTNELGRHLSALHRCPAAAPVTTSAPSIAPRGSSVGQATSTVSVRIGPPTAEDFAMSLRADLESFAPQLARWMSEGVSLQHAREALGQAVRIGELVELDGSRGEHDIVLYHKLRPGVFCATNYTPGAPAREQGKVRCIPKI